jgi:hypothetical protein
MTTGRYNGAFYYSKEICKNIIPNVQTNRNWITINAKGAGCDYSIVFIHNNKNPQNYDWLKNYKDLVLVCGVPETCEKVAHLGKAIYLPLSVDVDYVEQFNRPKTKEAAYVGRSAKLNYEGVNLPKGIDCICGVKRQDMLPIMAQYKQIYGVGRVAIEAKVLGCEVLPYDSRFPDPDVWQILDNKDAANILQKELNRIDGNGK